MPDGNVIRQRVEGIVYREGRLDISGIQDEEKRIVRVSFSSEEPYLRRSWWEDPWIEVLGHNADEVLLDRLNTRATVHYNHNRSRADRIGVVLEADLRNQRGEATLQISRREDVEDLWTDIRDEVLCNISVGYNILERVLVKQNEDGPDEYRVTLWEPAEISFVDIPADFTIGAGRDEQGVDANRSTYYRVIDIDPPAPPAEPDEEKSMPPTDDKDQPKGDTIAKSEADALAKDAADKAAAKAAEDALNAETARRTEIRSVFEPHNKTDGIEDLLQKCLDDPSITVETARKQLLDEIGSRHTPTGNGGIQSGEDALDKFRDGAMQAIMARSGKLNVKQDLENPFRGYTLVELARHSLMLANQPLGGTRMEMVGRALNIRSAIGHSTSDFPQILADVANKAVLLGFSEAPETWQPWCRVGNLSDFKTARRVGLSEFSDLELVAEGGEYRYGTFSDQGETITLATYGKIFPITRQAIINDDLNAFSDVPMKMGRAAARVPGDLAYGVLTTNPLMSDGLALFVAGHNNIGTPAAAPNVTNVGNARTLMGLQTGIGGNANGLNIRLGNLLVPLELEDTAKVLRESENDPANTGNSRAVNPVRGTFEVIADPRLSADSATQWYATATQEFDTVEVAFLDGIQEPRVEEQTGWTVDGTEFKVGLDVAAAAMEFRSFVRNAGV